VATTDQTVSGVTGRYAQALFDLAGEENGIERVGAELASLKQALLDSPELSRMVRSPTFKVADQTAALDAIAAKAKIAGTTLNFLRLIAKNRRLSQLSGMISAFETLAAAAKGEMTADVVSAEKLSAQQIKDLKAALKETTGRDVALNASVDKSLLGGLVVRMGSRMMDNSLKTKLANLKIAMKGTA